MGANAQTSVPAFTSGQVLTAAQVTQINTGIPVFASSTERDAAFGGTGEKTLAEGQMAYLEDTNATQYYDGSSWSAIAGGKIIQLAFTNKVDSFTTTSGTFVDITGMSVSITPTSATSTIYVLATLTVAAATGHNAKLNLLRDSTDISQSTGGASFNMTKFVANSAQAQVGSPTILFQDSPATTSATTYKIQIACSTGGNTVAVNRRADNTTYGSTSSITVLEVSA